METIIHIKIKSPDRMNVIEEDKLDEGYNEEYDKEFSQGYHDMLVENAKSYFEKDVGDVTSAFEDDIMDGLEEHFIDGWEDFEDYKTEVSVEIVENKKDE